MKNIFIHIFRIIIATILISVVLYYIYPRFRLAIDQKYEWLFPCNRAITYSIGTVDPKFGISADGFLSAVQTGAKVWQDILPEKQLLKYTPTQGQVIINLVYDSRQESTSKLNNLGNTINNSKTNFEELRLKYENLKTVFNQDKAKLESDISQLDADEAEFEKRIQYWNSKGGAPKNEYDKLQREKDAFNTRASILETRRADLTERADMINSLGRLLNEQIENLNLNVEKYRDNQEILGDEFDQGEYILNESGRSINIYQFDNTAKLERVLAHELGHALGMGHNDNPKSIMYKIDQGISLTPSKEDIDALKSVCKIRH